ncbi:MAG: glycosyltransferase [Chromatocurvus sp.]
MSSAPRISVCVANYNASELLVRCLQSVLSQNVAEVVQVIVHDDASSDDSLARLAADFPDVRVIASSDNVGYCMANNRMLEVAVGDYVLLLNNDAWLEPGALQVLMDYAGAHPPAILTLAQLDAGTGELLDCGMGLDLLCTPFPHSQRVTREVATVIGACLWLPRQLWHDVGGFPAWFESIGEDLYLCQRARLRGVPVVALAEAAYYHVSGHSFGGGKLQQGRMASTFRRRYLSERNRLYVMCLVYPPLLLVPLLPLAGLALLVEGLLLSLWRMDLEAPRRIYLPALAGPVRERARLRALRRDLQRERTAGTGAFLGGLSPVPYKLRMLARRGLPTLR